MCASPPSLSAPDTPCRPRYRDACSGFTANTTYPAAISAATHGPRPVSTPGLHLRITTGGKEPADQLVQPRDPGHPLRQPPGGQHRASLVHHLDVVMVLRPVITH